MLVVHIQVADVTRGCPR